MLKNIIFLQFSLLVIANCSETSRRSGDASLLDISNSVDALPDTTNTSDVQVKDSTSTIDALPIDLSQQTDTAQVSDSAVDSTPVYADSAVLSITTNSLPPGIQNSSYTAKLSANGGTGNYTWTISNGALPATFQLGSSTGMITGNPQSASTTNFTVKVDDGASSATKALAINIIASSSTGPFHTEDWLSYQTTSDIMNQPYYEQSGGAASGESSLVTNLTSTPWGGANGVYVRFNASNNMAAQPQAGLRHFFGNQYTGKKELWWETWIKFDNTWKDIFTRPGITYDYDHKTFFVYERLWSQAQPDYRRWEFKFGPNGNDMIGAVESIAVGDYYEVGFIPPLGGSDWDTYNLYNGSSVRADARTLVWDNQWHLIRMHFFSDSIKGNLEGWIDGVKFVDAGQVGQTNTNGDPLKTLGDTNYSNYGDMTIVQFGANLNSPPAVSTGFTIGPYSLYDTNPGW